MKRFLLILALAGVLQFRSHADTRIAGVRSSAPVVVDSGDALVVRKAAGMYAEDIKSMGMAAPQLLGELPSRSALVIIAGTIGSSGPVDDLVKRGKINVDEIRGGWERYVMQTVRNPFPGISRALVIAGSDRRGTAYGILSLSEKAGVSPWVWWADVPYPTPQSLSVAEGTFVSRSPSVKYRGIFINDEDWGLLPWASETFDPDYGNIGPKTYAKVCELMLRLRANYLCPAMHRRSVAFNENPVNKAVADSFAVVMGSVHCEPLLYNNAREWDKNTQGAWNYESNKETINAVLTQRVRENGKYENVYTLALRGLHDKAMEGNSSLDERKKILENALLDQRKILESELGVAAETLPQAFTPYKEVLDLYNRGMKLPDDVTIIWPDDNYGYFKQLSNPREQKRSGRSGVYYHVSYHGKPHDYLWFSTTPPALMYEELGKAYRTGADRIWLLNAGDIKLCEYSTDLFLRMAWDMEAFDSAGIAEDHAAWLEKIFGVDMHSLVREFYDLSFPSKPEYMGWGQEWNTRYDKQAKVTDTEWSFQSYDEAQSRLTRYESLREESERIMNSLPEEKRAAYFELVHYPFAGSALMNEKLLKMQKSREGARMHRYSARKDAFESLAAADLLDSLTADYDRLMGGKWKHIASLRQGVTAHYFERPLPPVFPAGAEGIGVVVEGGRNLEFNSLLNKEKHIEIYSKSSQAQPWAIECDADWVYLARKEGQGDCRVAVSILPELMAPGRHSAILTIRCGSQKETVLVGANVSGELPSGPVFVEDDGVVSMPAADYTGSETINGVAPEILAGLGFEGRSVRLGDPLLPMQDIRDRVSCLEYDFMTESAGAVDVYSYVLPTFPLWYNETFASDFAGVNPSTHELRFGLSIDDAYVAAPSVPCAEYSQAWTDNVLRNCAVIRTRLNVAAPGRHTLRVLCADPGVVFQKFVIDFGGLRRSVLGPGSTLLRADAASSKMFTPAQATEIGGMLGEHLQRTRVGRVAHFIEGSSSPAVQLFAAENHVSNRRNWRGEHAGKWLCTASDLYRHTGDGKILSRLVEVADFLVSKQEESGWLGTYVPEIRFDRPSDEPAWDVWVNTYMIKGLVAVYNVTGNEKYAKAATRIASYMKKIFVDEKMPFGGTGFHGGLVSTGSVEPFMELLESYPGDDARSMVLFCIGQMESIPGLGLVSKFSEGRDCQSVANGKIYELLRNLTGLARYARFSADSVISQACRNAWNNIRDYHLSPSGCPWGGIDVHNEVFNPIGVFEPRQVCETCSAMEWISFTRQMMLMDGDAKYAEQIEKSLYNAIPGALGGEKSEWVYYTRFNGAVYRGSEWSCCWSSGMMASEWIPDLVYSLSGDDVRVNIYTPSRLDGVLLQSGDYAESGKACFELLKSGRFKLLLRNPEWTPSALVKSGDEIVPYRMEQGYIVLEKDWKKGERIEIAFPVCNRDELSRDSRDGKIWKAAFKGPLLLGRARGPLEAMAKLPWMQPSEEYNYWEMTE